MTDHIEPCFWVDTSKNPLGQRCDGEMLQRYENANRKWYLICTKCGCRGPLMPHEYLATFQHNRLAKFLDRMKFTVWEENR